MLIKKVFSFTLALLILLMPITGCDNKKSDSIKNSQVTSEPSSDTDVNNQVTTEEQAAELTIEEIGNGNTPVNNQNNNTDTDNKQAAQGSNEVDNSNNGADSSNKATVTPSAPARPNQPETVAKPQASVTSTVEEPQTTVAQAAENQQTATVNTDSQMISEVLRLVNEQRAANGLSALSYRSDLQQAADIRAGEIINTFSHTRPNGTDCFTVFKEIGVTNYSTVGENIASGYATAESVMNGWMNSEGHRANILNGNFEGMVVGIKKLDSNRYAWVQLFITQ